MYIISVHEIPELYTITYTQLKTMKIKERERNADRGLRRFKSMSDGFNIQWYTYKNNYSSYRIIDSFPRILK